MGRNYFTGLGCPMATGVGLTEEDEQDHSSQVVLSYAFWTSVFSRAPTAIGQALYIAAFRLLSGLQRPVSSALMPGMFPISGYRYKPALT
jgi:hypothetical protein